MKKTKKLIAALQKVYRNEDLEFKELQVITDFGKSILLWAAMFLYLYGAHCLLWKLTHPIEKIFD